MGSVVPEIGSGGQNKKKTSFLIFFSIGAYVNTSVALPCKESTDGGLNVTFSTVNIHLERQVKAKKRKKEKENRV